LGRFTRATIAAQIVATLLEALASGSAARPMIVEIRQLICCFISTKSEILHDHAAPRARGPRASPGAAPTITTITTHHVGQRHRLTSCQVP